MVTKGGSKAVKRGKKVIVKDLRPKMSKADQAKSVKGGSIPGESTDGKHENWIR